MSTNNYLNLSDLIKTKDESTVLDCMIKASKPTLSAYGGFGEVFSSKDDIGFVILTGDKSYTYLSIPDDYMEVTKGNHVYKSHDINVILKNISDNGSFTSYIISHNELEICGISLDNTESEL